MAGRLVVLEFDDRDAAEAFVTNPNQPEQQGFKVRAMYLSPTKFCQCPDKQRQDGRNWTKGRRTGLFLCIRCRKPSVFYQRGLLERLKFALGLNLLDTM